MGQLKMVGLAFLAWSAILALLWMQTSDSFLNLNNSGYSNYVKVGMGGRIKPMHFLAVHVSNVWKLGTKGVYQEDVFRCI